MKSEFGHTDPQMHVEMPKSKENKDNIQMEWEEETHSKSVTIQRVRSWYEDKE